MNSEEEIKLPHLSIEDEKKELPPSSSQVDEIFNLENVQINNKLSEIFEKNEHDETQQVICVQNERNEELKKNILIEEKKRNFVKKQGNSLKNIREISQALQKAKNISTTELSSLSLYSPVHKKAGDSNLHFPTPKHQIENIPEKAKENNDSQSNEALENIKNSNAADNCKEINQYVIQKKIRDDLVRNKKIRKMTNKKKKHEKTPLSEIFENSMEG
jgi:hypothetical protein